jgi:hypothetical protein
MRDYADACFRYLRATGLVNISHLGKSISIVSEKIQEVDYFLQILTENPALLTTRNNMLISWQSSDSNFIN